MTSRSKRCGQFSCTPGERVTMCSCISVGPISAVATGPSAVSTVVPAPCTSVTIRRAVLEGRDELALDGIDRPPEPLESGGAQHVEIARIAEEAEERPHRPHLLRRSVRPRAGTAQEYQSSDAGCTAGLPALDGARYAGGGFPWHARCSTRCGTRTRSGRCRPARPSS